MKQPTTADMVQPDEDNWAMIDLDTGTVLGTNIVLVPVPDDEDRWDQIQSHDATACQYGQQYGIPLYRESPGLEDDPIAAVRGRLAFGSGGNRLPGTAEVPAQDRLTCRLRTGPRVRGSPPRVTGADAARPETLAGAAMVLFGTYSVMVPAAVSGATVTP